MQTAFGWNDAKMQEHAPDVSFTYKSTSDDVYEVTCEWDTGNKVIVHHVQTKEANLLDSMAYDVTKADRKNPNGKVNGFNLTGLVNEQNASTGSVPTVGESCPSTGNADGTDNAVDKRITDVTRLSSSKTEAFYAWFGGISHQLVYPTPVVPTV